MSTLVPLVAVKERSDEKSSRPAMLHTDPVEKRNTVMAATAAWSLSTGKRVFDVLVAIAVLSLLGIPLLLLILCIRLSSRGSAIFVQTRIGQDGRPFSIYKLRTMKLNAAACGIGLTQFGDDRVTPLGRWLRKLKLDELPQFYNVLRGEMSVVGPRPKLPQYTDDLNFAYRPGITGAASLAFRCEEQLLVSIPANEIEDFYHGHIKPLKASIDARYMLRATFFSDCRIILSTFLSSFCPGDLSAHDATSAGTKPRHIVIEMPSPEKISLLRSNPQGEAAGLEY